MAHQTITATAARDGYEPRRAQDTVVYRVVAAELETFLASARDRGHPLPPFVENTLREFLSCGIAANGFLRVHCDSCGADRVVPFSCKRRGVCSSCGGRRMAETAANLIDRVLPQVPMRQWVLSLPLWLRYRLAYDRTLLTPVLGAFLRAVFASARRRGRRLHGVQRTKCGAVTFVQRFGGSANLNVHFHALVIDGVFAVPPRSGQVEFFALPPPSTQEVARVLADATRRIARALARAGLAEDGNEEADPLARQDPQMAALYAAAVQGRVAVGPRAGQPVVRLGKAAQSVRPVQSSRDRCVMSGGFSLHADVAVAAWDRAALERLCRYVARPALATERLTQSSDGHILYHLRHRWRDGTSCLVFEPQEFLARLAALVPPPRAHQTRYHGILAPCAGWRSHVVPAVEEQPGQAEIPAGSSDPGLSRSRSTQTHVLRRQPAGQVLLPRSGFVQEVSWRHRILLSSSTGSAWSHCFSYWPRASTSGEHFRPRRGVRSHESHQRRSRMVGISLSGSGEGRGWVTGRGYSTAGSPINAAAVRFRTGLAPGRSPTRTGILRRVLVMRGRVAPGLITAAMPRMARGYRPFAMAVRWVGPTRRPE